MRSSRSSHVDQTSRRNDYHYHSSNRNQSHVESNGHGTISEDYRSSKRPSINTATNLIKRMKSSTLNENNTTNRDHVNFKQIKSTQNSTAIIDQNECHQLNYNGYIQEESEALAGDSLDEKSIEDFEKFKQITSNLKELVKQILDNKKEKCLQKTDNKRNSKTTDALAETRTKGLMYFMELKNLNRLDKHRLKEARKRINSAKDKVDQINLQLQNIQYEVMHLQKEQKTCASFRSKDECLDLLEEEKFLISDHYPQDLKHLLISNGETVSFNRKIASSEEFHKFHMARLEWELEQRILSSSKLKMAQESRYRLEVEITTKKQTLSKFDPTLKNIIESAKPLVSQLNVPLQVYDKDNLLTSFLPQSLYVLYIQLCAYKTAFELNYEVNIHGSADEAEEFELRQKNENYLYFLKSDKTDDDDDNGQQIDEDEDESDRRSKSKKSRHHSYHKSNNEYSDPASTNASESKDSVKDDSIQKYSNLLQTHPMKIILIFRYQSYQMTIKFKYHHKLELISLDYNVENSSPNELKKSEFSVTDYGSNIFSKLISSDDTGYKCPNVTIEYLLRKYGIMSFSELIPKIGYTYDWAQRMAGIEYLNSDKKPTVSNSGILRVHSSIAMDCLDKTVKLINLRFQSRVHLEKQLNELFKNKRIDIDKFQKSFGCNNFEAKNEPKLLISKLINSSIDSFEKITSEQLIQEISFEKKKHLIEYFESEDDCTNDLFDENNFIFKLTINNRISEEISYLFNAFIIIPHNYPWRWPFFIIKFASGSECLPLFLQKKWIRSLEEHINVNLPQKIIQQTCNQDESNYSSTLLLRQVYDLQYGINVIIDSYENYIHKANDKSIEVYSGPQSVRASLMTSIVQGHDHSLKFQ